MAKNRTDGGWRYGELPDTAPLAMAYVPLQKSVSPAYESMEALSRGTLFPGLDLPFMGMVNEGTLSETQLHELQALGFAIVELGEYLDTHPDDADAFALFQSYAKLYAQGKEAYERQFGSLTQRGAAAGDCYCWLKGPWPWELAANEEE